MDHRSAARILDLAERPGSQRRALAGLALIFLLVAHGAGSGGFPPAAQAAAMSSAGAQIHARESAQMNRLMAISAAAVVTAGASAQNAVQWRVEDGGNGHWYVRMRTLMTWQEARDWSDTHGGYLVTLSSPEENALAYSLSVQPHTWLGGFQDEQHPEFSEPAGGWRWVSGESWDYSAWGAIEPNNYPPGHENWLATGRSSQTWADLPGDWTLPFIVEFDADCNNDGLVDYGQIQSGELADANANNIPDCCENGTVCGCAGDTNHDGAVDGIDLATILTRWAQPAAKFPDADCNRDGVIDGSDLAIVLGSWGVCP